MGCSVSRPYEDAIRQSVFASLIPESEWSAFLLLWKLESFSMMSKHPTLVGTAFLVVVSGEIHATISNVIEGHEKTTHSSHATIYRPGQIITLLYPQNSTQVDESSDGTIKLDAIKLCFSAKPTSQQASVAGISYESLKSFITHRPHLSALSSVVHFDIHSECSDCFEFEGFTRNQIGALGILTHLQRREAGSMLTETARTSGIQHGNKNEGRLYNYDIDCKANNVTGILVHGQLIVLAEHISPASFVADHFHIPAVVGPTESRGTKFRHSSKRSFFMTSDPATPVHHTTAFDSASVDVSEGIILQRGSIVGLEHVLVANPISMDNVMCLEESFVFAIEPRVIEALMKVHPKIGGLLQCNYTEAVIESIGSSVPIFSYLDTEDMRLLASSTRILTYAAGTTVCKQYEPADNFYVIVRGSVEELVHHQSSHNSDVEMAIGSTFSSGEFFGEVSLATESPYPTTMTCVEPSILLSINDKTFHSMFIDNKTKLCEIKMRLAGKNVDLEYIIMHPEGYTAFLRFLQIEHATENLAFWHAIDRFEETCALINKETVEMEGKNDGGGNNKSAHSASNASLSRFVGHSGRMSTSARISAGAMSSRISAGASSVSIVHAEASTTRSHTNNIKVLQDVGRSIMDKYIYEASPDQVNIPGKMRQETENLFNSWIACLSYTEDGEKPEIEPLDIFHRAKKEIFDLLKKDPFVRWKQTVEFGEFIATWAPKRSSSSASSSRRSSVAKSKRPKSMTFNADAIAE